MQTDIRFGNIRNKRPIEPHEALAVVKIREREPVLEDEVGHRDRNAAAAAAPSIFVERW